MVDHFCRVCRYTTVPTNATIGYDERQCPMCKSIFIVRAKSKQVNKHKKSRIRTVFPGCMGEDYGSEKVIEDARSKTKRVQESVNDVWSA